MKIVISEHAKRRAEERGIDEETIRSVLEEPLDVIKGEGESIRYGVKSKSLNTLRFKYLIERRW